LLPLEVESHVLLRLLVSSSTLDDDPSKVDGGGCRVRLGLRLFLVFGGMFFTLKNVSKSQYRIRNNEIKRCCYSLFPSEYMFSLGGIYLC
jgi:hypothetical protein